MTAPATPRAARASTWVRKHLFRTWVDGVVTIVSGAVGAYLLYRLTRYVFVTGRWDIVRDNLSLFMVGSYDRDELWRPATALIVASGLGGLFAGVIRTRQVRAGSAEQDVPTDQRIRDLAIRLWPGVLGVLLLLALAETLTPWLVVAGSLGAAVVGRMVGSRLPARALPWLLTGSLVITIVLIWVMASEVGWDDWGGLMLNLFLAAISIALCFPIGVMLALGRRSSLPIIRGLSTGYIELFRGVPLIALLLMANVALGFFVPQDLVPGKVVRAIVVFTLFTAAYVAEIVRGGLQSVPRGQIEAGQAQGLSPFHVTFLIVLPQALRNVIPALVGQFISLFKDTTLAGAAMGFLDLLSASEAARQQPGFAGQALFAESLLFVSFIFWLGSYTMSRESQRLEKKLGVGER